jgi:hypothetical protein
MCAVTAVLNAHGIWFRELEAVASGEGYSGPAIGLIPNAQFKTTEVKLASGDFLLFFTDGVIEVEDKAGRDFGIEGLRQALDRILISPPNLSSKPLLVMFVTLAAQRSLQTTLVWWWPSYKRRKSDLPHGTSRLIRP